MAQIKCDQCRSQRWLVYGSRFVEYALVGAWRPFDRGCWDAYGDLAISAALAAGALKACPSCNPNKLAPWAKAFEGESDALAPKPSGVQGGPF